MVHMVENGPKLFQNGAKWWKMVKMVGAWGPLDFYGPYDPFSKKGQFQKNDLFSQKNTNFQKNDQFSEKNTYFQKNHPFQKMTHFQKRDPFSKEGPIFKKWPFSKKKSPFSEKNAIFIGPDLKRARRNGLSAQGREGPSREARRASS